MAELSFQERCACRTHGESVRGLFCFTAAEVRRAGVRIAILPINLHVPVSSRWHLTSEGPANQPEIGKHPPTKTSQEMRWLASTSCDLFPRSTPNALDCTAIARAASSRQWP